MDSNHRPARVPISTYRVQFNSEFGFRDAKELVPYLDGLGITDLYASPYLQARPGSTHGYDVSSHERLNPEVGTEAEHAELSAELRERGMGQLLDIVPNHMGIGEPANEWWMDVLENGQSSPYATYFDIEWDPVQPHLAGKVLLPVLGDQFGRVLEAGELRLAYDDGRFELRYHEHLFPVSPKSSSLVLRTALREMPDGEDRLELESLVTALEHLPPRDRTDEASRAERTRENHITRKRLRALHAGSEAFRERLAAAVTTFNGSPGEPASFDRLERLLNDQAYRLAFWRIAAEEINYRRFFDINELAGLRMDRGEVFQDTHRLILRLVGEGKVTGLRIDHPDGLYDPGKYFEKLRDEAAARSGEAPYVLVEKILTGEEELPSGWAVAGTVGYEFMNRLNGLFVPRGAEADMDEVYAGFIGRRIEFRELVYERKKLILKVSLASELNVLAHLLDQLSEENRCFRDFTLGALRDALRETIACFPVYRTYIDAESGQVSETDRRNVEWALRDAMRRNPSTSRVIYDFLRSTLLLEWPERLDESARREHAAFVMKFQQLTGPVMAKGVEDTSFYIFNRLVSLNEVGGEPDRFGVDPREYHEWVMRRRERWPGSMNSTSTHDTKRSEDVRARIDALAEMPERWANRVRYWAKVNAERKVLRHGDSYPDANAEYLLYQTLVGVWPLEPVEGDAHEELVRRVGAYMEKATREAKVRTSWINPNEEYDEALQSFVSRVLDPVEGRVFLDDLLPFQTGIARIGMLNSLSQTALKLTTPGVPDIYQGQEVWDFSLVDPDNRRPVDYAERREMLARIDEAASAGREALAAEVMESWRDGRVKMYLTSTLLRLRREMPELWSSGEYTPLTAEGERADHLVAFSLAHAKQAVIVVVPRLWGTLLADAERAMPDAGLWHGTRIPCPAGLSGRYTNVLTGARAEVDGNDERAGLGVADALGGFPVGVLTREG